MLKHLASHFPYFSVVAKHLSFSQAAIELSVSQSSISYQIKALETKLGFKLFIRGKGSTVELTEKGNKLFLEYLVLERNFNQVVLDTQINHARTTIELTAPIDIGAKLLSPALSLLERGQLIVNLDLTDTVTDLKKSAFDFSIRNTTAEKGLEYVPLVAVRNRLICSQNYRVEHDINDFSLLTEEHRLIVRNLNKSRSWEGLFQRHDKCFQQHNNRQVISNSFGIFQAVIAGSGIAILPEYFVEPMYLEELFIFDEVLDETQFYLAFQPSYIASRWADDIRACVLQLFQRL